MDARKYAQWLIDNESKKGTPEFETVATAYKVARAGGLDQYAQQKEVGGPTKRQNPMTFDSDGNPRGAGEKFLIGAGKGLTDTARGLGQLVGAVSEADVTRAKERDAPITESGLGQLGNVAGTTAAFLPAAMIPGAGTAKGASVIGAAIGGSQPVAEGESRATNAAIGAASGLGGQAAGKALSRTLNPQTSPAAKELLDQGVGLTPGQVAGGSVRRVEEGLKSLPVVGDMVRNAEVRSLQDFNRAVINSTLKPIGQKVEKIGNEGVEEAGQLISKAYDEVLSEMPVSIDNAARTQLNNVVNMVEGGLAPAQQQRFGQIMQDLVLGKMTPFQKMSGESYKNIVSTLGKQASKFRRSQDAEQQSLGDALLEAQRILKDVAKRQNPQKAAQLSKVDEAYSKLLRVEDAAVRGSKNEGLFTAAQLAQASKKLDGSLRKRASARGQAETQKLAQTGEQVLGSKVPDSGTPFRLANMALLGTPFLDPATLAALGTGAGAGAAAYSRSGTNVLAKLLAERPEIARQLGVRVEGLLPGAGLAGAATAD